MQILDTLDMADKIKMYNGFAVGIFEHLFESDDEYYNLGRDMCLTYYTHRSGCKHISPTFKKAIEMQTSITKSANEIIATIVRGKYKPTWDRIYLELTKDYDALQDYEVFDNKTVNSTDDFTHGHTITDDGNESSKVTNTSTDNNTDKRWGFNSVNSVPTDENNGTSTNTSVRDADDNQVHSERKNTGTDKRVIDGTENISRSGRHSRGSSLLKNEIDFRLKTQFYNMVFDHIDEIATLDIYI